MIKRHYEYLGYPRSGSTFLYNVFKKHSYFSNSFKELRKENNMLEQGKSIQEYKNVYLNYDYSMNMCTRNSLLNSSQIKELAKCTDKFFFLVRNPYDFLKSVCNFVDGSDVMRSEAFMYSVLDYTRTIDRIKKLVDSDVGVFIFDDLIENKYNFVEKIFDFLEVPNEPVIDGTEFTNTSKLYSYSVLGRSIGPIDNKPTIELEFTAGQIELINNYIDKFSDYMQKDLSHWRKEKE